VTTDGTAVLKAYDSSTRVALIDSVTDRRAFRDEELWGFADGWFDEGLLVLETGANTGVAYEVKRSDPAWRIKDFMSTSTRARLLLFSRSAPPAACGAVIIVTSHRRPRR
jgi:hypothetical protein